MVLLYNWYFLVTGFFHLTPCEIHLFCLCSCDLFMFMAVFHCTNIWPFIYSFVLIIGFFPVWGDYKGNYCDRFYICLLVHGCLCFCWVYSQEFNCWVIRVCIGSTVIKIFFKVVLSFYIPTNRVWEQLLHILASPCY